MSNVSRTLQRDAARSQGWSTQKLVSMALFVALSVIFSFVELPIFPAAPYLKYDASAVIAAFAAFSFGPVSGLLVGLVSACLHGVVMGDPWGTLMTCIVVACWVLPAGLIHARTNTRRGALVGLIVGAAASVAGAILGNLVVTPIYTGTDMVTVVAMVLPILLPFNLLKAVINVGLSWLLYTPVQAIATRGKRSA